MPLRANTLSIHELSDAVNKAVDAVVAKQGTKLIGDRALLSKWELMGRRLQDVDIQVAQQFSLSVANQVSESGFKVQPATLLLSKGDILAGFFPVEAFTDFEI